MITLVNFDFATIDTSTAPYIGWDKVGLAYALAALGPIALKRFQTGWGDGGKRLLEQGAWGRFLARFGFAILPLTIGFVGLASTLLFGKLLIETELLLFAVLAALAALVMFGCWMWAVKEALRPSGWRRRPAWLDEFEKKGRYEGLAEMNGSS